LFISIQLSDNFGNGIILKSFDIDTLLKNVLLSSLLLFLSRTIGIGSRFSANCTVLFKYVDANTHLEMFKEL